MKDILSFLREHILTLRPLLSSDVTGVNPGLHSVTCKPKSPSRTQTFPSLEQPENTHIAVPYVKSII